MIAIMQRSRLLAWLLVVMLWLRSRWARSNPPPRRAASAAFTPEQLEQLAAPIALYPDPLLAQVLMASTYPLEIVQAARFVKDNPNLKGDQLDEKLKDQTWDDSVKSLVAFPQVLALMDEKLDWIQKLGDAVLGPAEGADGRRPAPARARPEGGQPQEHARADSDGRARGRRRRRPRASRAPRRPWWSSSRPAQVITIEPANPQVVYVPSYNPTVVYGPGRIRRAPPYYPYPPGYAFGAAALSFGVGMAVGAAVWGNCNWGGGNVDVERQQERRTTRRNVNRTERRQSSAPQRATAGPGWQPLPVAAQPGEPTRRPVPRPGDRSSSYNRGSNPQAAPSLARPSAGGPIRAARSPAGAVPSSRRRRVQRGGSRQRPRAGKRRGSGIVRGRDAGAFQGMGGGSNARDASNRGQSSRQSIGASGGGGGARRGWGRWRRAQRRRWRWRRRRGGGGGGGRGGGGRR